MWPLFCDIDPMHNIVYIATSLDGFIAKKDGNIDWLTGLPNPTGSDYGFAGFMDSVDAVLMGRNTFEIVLPFPEWLYRKPVFVLSNTLTALPEKVAGKAEVISGPIDEVLKALNAKGIKTLYVDGGKTIQTFLKLSLIDELVITRVPIILGSGIPLFGELNVELGFEHVSTEVFDNLLVKSRYLAKR